MSFKITFILRFIFLLLSTGLYGKEIALTFDDAPRHGTRYFSGNKRSKALINNLSSAKVERVGFFVIGNDINEEGRKRLSAYTAAGHFIGNHTHTHPDINTTSASEYTSNIAKADKTLSILPGFVKLFRFPFLREGNDVEKRNTVRKFLKQRKYKNAYITIDNYDWYIDKLFQDGLRARKKVNLENLRQLYLDVLFDCLNFYDEMAVKALNRSPAHVILLHENDVAALFIGNFVERLRSHGWQIVPPETAYQDEIASYDTDQIWKYNAGRVAEIAKDKGLPGPFWHDSEDEKYLEQLFEKRKVFEEAK